MANRIKTKDIVEVISGKDKGKQGEVLRVLRKRGLVVVSGVNVMSHHIKQRQGTRQTGIVLNEEPIHLCKVLLVDQATKTAGRVGWKILEDKSKERYIKKADRKQV